ncbi:hypothetical protein HMI56_001863 [Coelomomyces lativittatus]|nr:hypothetical protein HMI56_001863 [Coelomomyces lativittatus]
MPPVQVRHAPQQPTIWDKLKMGATMGGLVGLGIGFVFGNVQYLANTLFFFDGLLFHVLSLFIYVCFCFCFCFILFYLHHPYRHESFYTLQFTWMNRNRCTN